MVENEGYDQSRTTLISRHLSKCSYSWAATPPRW